MTAPEPDSVVSLDEVGIATARNGGLVLRSAFQLVYRQTGGLMHAVAAEGFLRPFLEGAPVAPRGFLDACDTHERGFVERLCAILHMRNRHQVAAAELDLVVAVDPAPTSLLRLAADIDAAGMDPARLVCAVRPPLPDDAGVLARAARTLGVRILVTSAADGSFSFDAIRRAEPDIVRIDGAWFRRVSENEDALRLMGRLVDGFRGQGVLVGVQGIETQRQLAAALYLGPDFYQGYLLSRPELAGTAGDAPPLPLSGLFRDEAKVIPLKSRG